MQNIQKNLEKELLIYEHTSMANIIFVKYKDLCCGNKTLKPVLKILSTGEETKIE